MTLDPRPARELTDRECGKILGAVLGGLITMSNTKTVRAAVRWWADNDLAWEVMQANQDKIEQAALRMSQESLSQKLKRGES